jgi:hypothetical protein
MRRDLLRPAGAGAAARAPADGDTIHLYDGTAFAHVPDMRNIGELIARAKANPGKLDCASAGAGAPHHLIAEQGVTGFDAQPWRGFVGPAGIPAEPQVAALREAAVVPRWCRGASA